MQELTKKISQMICTSLNISGEEKEVLEYGMAALVQIVIFIPIILFIGILTGTWQSALIICFAASFLRKSSGGVHVSSINICTIIGITYCLGSSVFIQNILKDSFDTLGVLKVVLICFIIALIVIYLRVPVDSENKPIKTEKKRERLRKESFIILGGYFLLTIILIYLSFKENFNTVYIWSILFGLMWQIFTLTRLGEKSIQWLDSKMGRIWNKISNIT